MLNLKFNRFLNCRILLLLVMANNLFGDSQKPEFKNSVLCISESEIYRELNSIIKLEQKNSTFRKLGYAAVATGAVYYTWRYFGKTKPVLTEAQKKELANINLAQASAAKKLSDFIELNSKHEMTVLENNSKQEVQDYNNEAPIKLETLEPLSPELINKQKLELISKESYYFGMIKNVFQFFLLLNPEQKEQLFHNLAKLSEVPPKHGYISGFLHGVWGIGTSIGFQLALGATIAWTGKNFYKHFMPLSYEYFIAHHTNFEQALEMVNACTLLDPEKAQDELYVALSKENLKLAYSQLIKEGQKVIAFILYTRIKNKNMEQISKTTLDNLTENLKNNLSDISNFIETHNLLAIRNRIAAINNTSKMVVNFETVSAAN